MFCGRDIHHCCEFCTCSEVLVLSDGRVPEARYLLSDYLSKFDTSFSNAPCENQSIDFAVQLQVICTDVMQYPIKEEVKCQSEWVPGLKCRVWIFQFGFRSDDTKIGSPRYRLPTCLSIKNLLRLDNLG